MAGKAIYTDLKGDRIFAPAPKGFDALTASKTDLARHGLPQRPDRARSPDRRRSGSSARVATRASSI